MYASNSSPSPGAPPPPLLLRKQEEKERDSDVKTIDEEEPLKEEEKLYCAECGHLITKGLWRISVGGDHEHTFFNPAGVIFELFCFKEAPGAASRGQPSAEFTWFKGYTWRISHCAKCAIHLGWQFSGADAPRLFFALIQSRLTSQKPDES